MLSKSLMMFALWGALIATALGQSEKVGPKPQTAAGKTAKEKPEKPGKPKPYDEVITKEAQSLPGVFMVHRIDDKVYFEIPEDGFDHLMLWRTEVAKGSEGSWGGKSLGSNVVYWQRRGNKVYLWKAGFDKRSEGNTVRSAVESANLHTIVAAFNVEADGKDRSAVILATPLFTTDVADLSVKEAGGGGPIDESRSYLSEVKAFPTNIEVRSLLTFKAGDGGAPGMPGRRGRGRPGGGGHSTSALVHYSLVQLPETPMRGRYFDPRVGYFTERFEKYDDPKTWEVNREFIARYRLEKQDPTKAVSKPIKPIVFYLSNEIPDKWRPYLKKGVEDWEPAFAPPALRMPSSARRPRRAAGTPKMPAGRSSAGWLSRFKTPWGRTCTTRARAKRSRPISFSGTTSSSCRISGISRSARASTHGDGSCLCPMS